MYFAIQRRRSKFDSSETRFMASCPGLALVRPGWGTGKSADRIFVGFGDHDVRFWAESRRIPASNLALL
jgi:hypothetical protein